MQRMTLTTEELGDVPDVDAMTLDEVIQSDSFGKFAVLCMSDDEFIQAGNDWQPTDTCQAFLEKHESDPWVLEFREAGQQYVATGNVTLEQVRQAFQSYLAGGPE